MRPSTTCFVSLFFMLLLASVSRSELRAGERAPHGLASQNPISLSPSSYDFFHPNGAAQQPAPSKCSSFSVSSAATQVHQPALPGTAPIPGSRGVGPAGTAGIVVGLAVALLVAMGAYYVLLTRRSNANKLTNSPSVV